ncbi:MAG TPA: hypothetical protein VJ647_05550 [Chitinophagaceae bacterium]|nr:hypothetical protein [Chitinophagaceae bacterium]
MRAAIFFVCLCTFLSGGREYICSIAQNSHYFSSAQHIRKSEQPEFTGNSQNYSIIKNVNPEKERTYLFTDDVEEEDTNDVFARKYKLLVQSFLTLSLLVLSYLYGRSKAPRPFFSFLSYKYITQRVLRI